MSSLATKGLYGRLLGGILAPRRGRAAVTIGTRAKRWPKIFASIGWSFLTIFLALFVGLSSAILPMRLIEVPLAVIAIIVVLFLWSLRRVRRVPLKTTRLIFLIYVPVFCTLPQYLAISAPGMPWISIHRILLALLLILFGYCWGGSPEVRQTLGTTYRANRNLFRIIGAVYLAFGLSILTSKSPVTSFSFVAEGLLQWMLPFLAVILFVRSDEDTEAFIRLLVICLMITVSDAVVESFVKDKLFVKLLPGSFFQNNPVYLETFAPRMRDGLYRASANFAIPLSFAEFCALIAPFCLYFVTFGRRTLDRLLGGVGYVGVAVGLFLAHGRGGVIGFIISTAIFGFLFGLRASRRHPGRLFGPMILSLFAVAAGCMPVLILSSHRLTKQIVGGADTQSSTNARMEQWHMAVPHILSNPITGHGAGMGAGLVGWTVPGGSYISLDSYVITLLVDAGVIGLVSFFGLLIYLIWRNGRLFMSSDDRAAPAAAICAAVSGFTVNRFVLSQFENHTTLFMLAGLSATLAWRLAPSSKTVSRDTRAGSRAASTAPIIVPGGRLGGIARR